MAAAIDRTVQLADGGVLRVPDGRPIPAESFSDAVYLAEAAEHGGKPLLVFRTVTGSPRDQKDFSLDMRHKSH